MNFLKFKLIYNNNRFSVIPTLIIPSEESCLICFLFVQVNFHLASDTFEIAEELMTKSAVILETKEPATSVVKTIT